MSPRDKFLKRLQVLAKLCRDESVVDVLDLYDRVFAKVGYMEGAVAVEKVILERNSRDPFPSIAELRRAAVNQPEEIDIANECAGKIFEAITKCGWNAPDKAREFMGDIAWRLVGQFGGWLTLCESIGPKNATTYRAQFRDSALASIRLAKTNRLVGPPTFASLGKTTEEIQSLVSCTAGQLGSNDNARKTGGTDENKKEDGTMLTVQSVDRLPD